MEQTHTEQKDQWQIALDKALIELYTCQKSKGLDSCMRCPDIFNCKTKEDYVKKVYESMNKGAGGGFEF